MRNLIIIASSPFVLIGFLGSWVLVALMVGSKLASNIIEEAFKPKPLLADDKAFQDIFKAKTPEKQMLFKKYALKGISSEDILKLINKVVFAEAKPPVTVYSMKTSTATIGMLSMFHFKNVIRDNFYVELPAENDVFKFNNVGEIVDYIHNELKNQKNPRVQF